MLQPLPVPARPQPALPRRYAHLIATVILDVAGATLLASAVLAPLPLATAH